MIQLGGIMKRRIVLCVMVALLLGSTITAYGANISINGVPVSFTAASGSPFVDSANRTQVPLRAAMEAYGCKVVWDAAAKTAEVSRDGVTVEVPVGANYILKDGKEITIDSPALIKNNRTYLPIRAVLESFGASIGWDAVTQTVLVSNGEAGNIMKIHFINVGQGDSIFVDYGDTEVLIDGGNNAYGDTVVNYIKPYVDGELEYVIATHTDADHIGGLDNVLSAFSVGEIIDSGDTADTVTWIEYNKAVLAEPNCKIIPDSDLSISLGDGAVLQIIETGDDNGSSNSNSVVSLIDYNSVEVLLTGDMEGSVETANLSKWSDVDVLKAGHHGSYTASLASFLNVIRPEYVIVSAGTNNTYGHPHKETMDRFAAIGATVFGTFNSGSIVMTTNGSAYSFNTSTPITSADAGASGSTNVTKTTVQTTATPSAPADILYVGNSNTKKFHDPDCYSAGTISPEHLVYFSTRQQAISAGYVPCKNCNP